MLLWLSVATVAVGLQLRGGRAECNCACCSVRAPEEGEPLRCGVPLTSYDAPGAYFASCSLQCTAESTFVIASARGNNEFDLERFCFHSCEPAVQAAEKAGGACQPLTQATVERTYTNTTHSTAFEGTSEKGDPVGNELGNGVAPVLEGDAVLSPTAGYACAVFRPAQVCHDSGSLSCTVGRPEFTTETCNDICSAKKMTCLNAWAGPTCPQNTTEAAGAPEPAADANATANVTDAVAWELEARANMANSVAKHGGSVAFPGPSTACRNFRVGVTADKLEPVTFCECAL